MNEKVSAYFDGLRGKRIAVLGIGVSNRPLIRMLLDRGLTVLACDKTPREKLDDEVLELERLGATLHVGDGYLDGVQADIVFYLRAERCCPHEFSLCKRRQSAGALRPNCK